jgi:hypothetical protein
MTVWARKFPAASIASRRGVFELPEAMLRLRPDLGAMTLSGSDVASWTDAKGGHAFTEATNRPVYGATSGPNSTPGVTFTSANSDVLRNSTFPAAFYGLNTTERDIPVSILFVGTGISSPGYTSIFYWGAGTGSAATGVNQILVNGGTAYALATGGTIRSLFTLASTPEAFLVTHPGGAGGSGQGNWYRFKPATSGTWDTTATNPAGTASVFDAMIGAQPTTSPGGAAQGFTTCVVSEIAVWAGVLSSTQRAEVSAYVASRYAIT